MSNGLIRDLAAAVLCAVTVTPPTAPKPKPTPKPSISTRGKTINGYANKHLKGTARNDTINGWEGKDTIHGLGGNDTIVGGLGADKRFGDSANDTIRARDRNRDTINCGAADKGDLVAKNCETVRRR